MHVMKIDTPFFTTLGHSFNDSCVCDSLNAVLAPFLLTKSIHFTLNDFKWETQMAVYAWICSQILLISFKTKK